MTGTPRTTPNVTFVDAEATDCDIGFLVDGPISVGIEGARLTRVGQPILIGNDATLSTRSMDIRGADAVTDRKPTAGIEIKHSIDVSIDGTTLSNLPVGVRTEWVQNLRINNARFTGVDLPLDFGDRTEAITRGLLIERQQWSDEQKDEQIDPRPRCAPSKSRLTTVPHLPWKDGPVDPSGDDAT